MIVIGAMLLFIGFIGGVAGFVVSMINSIDNPPDDAVETLDFSGLTYEEFHYNSGGVSDPIHVPPQTVTLEAGVYDVWYNKDYYSDPVDLTVQDSSGGSVYVESTSGETVSINGESYAKAGSLDIGSKGEYTFQTDDECTLYITEPPSTTNLWIGIAGSCVGGFLVIAAGATFLIVGIVKLINRNAKKSRG